MHLSVCGSAILVCSHLRTSDEFTHDSMPNSGACNKVGGFITLSAKANHNQVQLKAVCIETESLA